jgi:hypothetical protein
MDKKIDDFSYLFDDDLFMDNDKFNENDTKYSKLLSPTLFPECKKKVHKDFDEEKVKNISKIYISFLFSEFLNDYIVQKDSCCLYGENNGQKIYDYLVEFLGKITLDFDLKPVNFDIKKFIDLHNGKE